MLSTATVYALRAMVCLAAHPGEPLTGRQIAGEAEICSEYLAKVLGTLARNGLVSSRRGRRGGFRLARPAEKITLLDVIRATEAWEPFETCPAEPSQQNKSSCRLMAVINQAVADIEQRLDEINLDQAFEEPIRKNT